MDSLLASYASSDEEDERPQPPQISSSSRPKSAIFSALPPPKSSGEAFSFRQPKGVGESRDASTTSSLFSSLPQPKTPSDVNPVEKQHPPQNSSFSRPKSAIFSALPPPKSSGEATLISTSLPQPKASPGPNPDLNPKKVVQFRPPTLSVRSANPTTFDDEEDDEEQDSRTRKQSASVAEAPSVKSFLSSMPAARYSSTLGVSGSGRRSIIDTQVPDPAPDELGAPNDSAIPQDAGGGSSMSFSVQTGTNYEQGTAYGSYDPGVDYNGGNYGTYHVGGDPSSGYASYENYNGQYENNWADQAGNVFPDSSCSVQIPVELPRKRGRKDIPTEILEVKQDDLMKNRPREDQVKLTGIAFGPAYQPASTKGKPSKLQKRKHQIGSLFFDMKQKEMELAERRSRGFLTKAETQAKYGW